MANCLAILDDRQRLVGVDQASPERHLARPSSVDMERRHGPAAAPVVKNAKPKVAAVQAGTPHWFKKVPGPLDYFVVKVIKP